MFLVPIVADFMDNGVVESILSLLLHDGVGDTDGVVGYPICVPGEGASFQSSIRCATSQHPESFE